MITLLSLSLCLFLSLSVSLCLSVSLSLPPFVSFPLGLFLPVSLSPLFLSHCLPLLSGGGGGGEVRGGGGGGVPTCRLQRTGRRDRLTRHRGPRRTSSRNTAGQRHLAAMTPGCWSAADHLPDRVVLLLITYALHTDTQT